MYMCLDSDDPSYKICNQILAYALFHLSHGDRERKASTYYMFITESMILEGGVWAGGGKIPVSSLSSDMLYLLVLCVIINFVLSG